MNLYSNGPKRDYVSNPYRELVQKTSTLFVASPFVTITDDLFTAAENGKAVRLLVGLNVATDPKAIRKVFGKPNISIRYYTHRFHAKIYLSDTCALIGSSNLTDGGMQSNREATILLQGLSDVEEVRVLAQELWSSAPVLTADVLSKFEVSVGRFGQMFNHDKAIEDSIGRKEPANIRVGSDVQTSEYLFLEALRSRVYDHFKPAFDEVARGISVEGRHRPEWNGSDEGSETNRFLNWVRLTYGPGDEWRSVGRLSAPDREAKVASLGREWATTQNPRIADNYFVNLSHLRKVFQNQDTLQQATREDLSAALMGVHAFEEQIRFIKGGYGRIIPFFWEQNDGDDKRVKNTFSHLLFGRGEFIERLYSVLNFPQWKIRYFGESCALELAGTLHPDICPPLNGRSAKGLCVLGYKVPTN